MRRYTEIMKFVSLLLGGLLAVAAAPLSAADETPKKKPKKAGYDYNNSKYKAYKVLTEDQERTYRFNEKGEPVKPAEAKKAKKKPARKSSEASDGGAVNCEADQSCQYQEGY